MFPMSDAWILCQFKEDIGGRRKGNQILVGKKLNFIQFDIYSTPEI